MQITETTPVKWYNNKQMISTASIKRHLYLKVVQYFRFFANQSLRRWSPRVIAVTGSVGKTTLLNLIELQLGERAHYSHNANSAYGISFDILGMDGVRGSRLRWFYLFIAAPFRALWFRHTEEFYVVEVDGERPQETEFLATWLRPEVTLWVSVGRTHAVYFDEQVRQGLFPSVDEAIVHEFSYLPKHTQKLVIYDGDNQRMSHTMQAIDSVEKKTITKRALEHYQSWPDRTEFIIAGTTYTVSQPMPRTIYVQLAMLGELAAYLEEPVITDLSRYVQPPGRSNFFHGIKNTKLIDSSYNAHLISMQSIVELYKEMQTESKWIVIGDIVEQGEAEAQEHAQLGTLLKEAQFDRYILVGRRTQKYTYPQMDSTRTVTFLHPKDAAKYIAREITGGETIVFKGSQYLEGIVEYLLLDKHQAAELPRQEPAARKRRAKWGLA